MKKNIKKFTAILLALIFSISLFGCGNNNTNNTSVYEYGEIENSELENENMEEKEEVDASLPTYDVSNLEQAEPYTDDKYVIKSSYYKELLPSRPRKAFDTIYYSAQNLKTKIDFESSQFVTPNELKNIMNILYLDCPEIFYMDYQYDYITNTEGYVTSIQLYYGMTEEEIEKINNTIANNLPLFVKLRDKDDYNTITQLIKKAYPSRYSSVSSDADGNFDTSCIDTFGINFSNMYPNSISNARFLCYLFRQVGIDATVAIGEPVSSELVEDYELVTDYIKFCEESNIGENTYNVKLNYSSYWLWNLVKLNDKWYNIDTTYSYLITAKNKSIPSKSLVFATDRMLSQTRLWYINEEILGISPSCEDPGFLDSYRRNNVFYYYIMHHDENQAILRIRQEIAEIDAQSSILSISYQFEDEETFNYFLDNFEEQFEYYNNTYANPFGRYNIIYSRDALIITIKDIIQNH